MWELVLKEDLAALEAKISALQADIQALKDAPTIPDGIEERIEALEALTNPSGMATSWAWFAEEIRQRYPATVYPSREGLGADKTSLINGGSYVSNDGRLRVESGARLAHTDAVKLVGIPSGDSVASGNQPALVMMGNAYSTEFESNKRICVIIKINGMAKIKGAVFCNTTGAYLRLVNGGNTILAEKRFSDTLKNVTYGFEFDYDGGNMKQGETLYLLPSSNTTLGLRYLKVNY